MEESKVFIIKCRSHSQEICKFYCKDCTHFICLQCLEGPHESHTFSTIKGADADIRQELKKFVDAKQGECICVHSLLSAANNRRKQLETDKANVIEEIDFAMERVIKKVHESKTASIVELDGIVCNLNKDIDSVQVQLENLAAKIAEQDITGMGSNDVLQLFSDTRDFVSLHNTILAKSIPKFVQSEQVSIFNSVGNFEIVDHERKKSTELFMEETGSEENTSDEEADDTNPITIQCQSFKNIEMVVPLTNFEAWVIGTTNRVSFGTYPYSLQKILNEKLYKTVYKEYQNNNKPTPFLKFKLMKDGSFLTTWNTELKITRTLKDMRTVPFTHIAEHSPYNLAVLDDAVFVYVCIQNNDRFSSFESIIQFDTNGIKTNTLLVPENCRNGSPVLVEVKRTDISNIFHYILFSKVSWREIRTICLLKQKIETGTVDYLSEFSGVFGENPAKEFYCHGFCIDGENVVVSDRDYKCVYILDGKDLKFKKILINNTDFKLCRPSCVAVSEDFLWLVEDNKKAFKFKYDRKKNELLM